jgi:hypothetical protein
MSQKICVQFEVRNMLIMKDTLKQMGIDYEEINQNAVRIGRSYQDITIDGAKGTIKFDSASSHEVNNIKQNYMVNFYRDKAIREGNQLREERMANGEIRLHVTHS